MFSDFQKKEAHTRTQFPLSLSHKYGLIDKTLSIRTQDDVYVGREFPFIVILF